MPNYYVVPVLVHHLPCRGRRICSSTMNVTMPSDSHIGFNVVTHLPVVVLQVMTLLTIASLVLSVSYGPSVNYGSENGARSGPERQRPIVNPYRLLRSVDLLLGRDLLPASAAVSIKFSRSFIKKVDSVHARTAIAPEPSFNSV
jgi:hypothetical protein